MGIRCLAIYMTLVLGYCLQTWALLLHVIAAEDSVVLKHVMEAEIDATKQQLEHYQHKADLLRGAIKKFQRRNEHEIMKNTSNVGDLGSEHTVPLRRSRTRESPQLFNDWFEPQGSFKSSKGGANSTRLLTQLVSFRPNTSPVGRRQQRKRKRMDDELPLQFLLVLDQDSTIMSLFHPTTFELMWQHALNLRSLSEDGVFRVADLFFMSDRTAHLAILSTSGDLALFKLRLWHNRRIVAGDTRRLKPLKDLEEKYFQCPVGQDSINVLDADPPWVQHSIFTRTTPTPGKYLHVDVEHVFGARLNHDWHYDGGKVAVVPLHYRAVVVTSDSSGGHLSFFHGDNGSFTKDIHMQINSHDDNVVNLKPIHSSRGLVALATQSQVFFVDVTATQLVPAVCEAPGRHRFTSLAADPQRPTVVYAGTSTGRVLMYKLHNFGFWRQRAVMSELESQGPVMCTLVDQLMHRRQPLPAFSQKVETVVQTLPGFLVFGVGARLVLYQLPGSIEDLQPTYLSERSLVGSLTLELDGINPPQIMGLCATQDLIVHSIAFAVLVFVPHGGHHLDIYESRIPPPGMNLDLTWIRVPVMMICALAAMFWQQKQKGGQHTFNEAELAGLLGARGRLANMGMKRGALNTKSLVINNTK